MPLPAPTPLLGLFGTAEIEQAAAVLVRACAHHGDTWQPITMQQVKNLLEHDVEHGVEPLASLINNPFFCPDFSALVWEGWARRSADQSAMELTHPALQKLRRLAEAAARRARR